MIPGVSGLIAVFCGWAGTAEGACALWVVPALLSYVNGALSRTMIRAVVVSFVLIGACLAGYGYAKQLPVVSVVGPSSLPTRGVPTTQSAIPATPVGESSDLPILILLMSGCLLTAVLGQAFARGQAIELATAPRCPRCNELIDARDQRCRGCGAKLK